jgi:CotH kinase protein/Lamin Tail Domain
MMNLRAPVVFVMLLLLLASSAGLYAQDLLLISEFMAVNDNGLDDEDRDEADWIEIHNAGTSAVDLDGWFLTDKADNLTKWQFPAVTLGPDAYLVVFASEKNRRDPTRPLHTNFKLNGHGEYLGLVRPDGTTVVSEFFPVYPIQAPDVSYGLRGALSQEALLAPGAPARARVPQDDTLEPGPLPEALRPWTLEDWGDAGWLTGTTGVGYDYGELIGLDVSAMRNTNQTVYIRVPFVIEDPSAIKTLTLRMRYDDGMIAYINGQEVARDNAPTPTTETWNSAAPENRSDSTAVNPVDFSIPQFDFLHVGTNVLALQGLNNGLTSSDLLILPELLATVAAEPGQSWRYFPAPTPGLPNNAGTEILGPIITDAEHDPPVPTEDEDIQITARIEPSFHPVRLAQLHYRVMFGATVIVPFRDDGASGDGESGDGIYGARIGADNLRPGEMVRWYITATDDERRTSRWPYFVDPLNAPQYAGTVVVDPRLTNPLPVLHWFIQDSGAANTDSGTRCTLFYDGQFYDNVSINLHGQSSRGFPKKSYDVDFHPGHNFKWAPGQPRADDINLLTTYPDKAQMRNVLAYETYRDADCPYHWVVPVRVQQNGAFWGTAHIVENGDEDWLIRLGLNADGALYKMYNTFTSTSHATSGAEKKTRKDEANTDLRALYDGINLSGEAQRRYLYDHLDVAQVVNYLAALIITGNTDCCHKNYYLYRDTGRSNEWQMWPWDVDLSFGRRWISSHTYWDQNLIPDTPLFIGRNNSLPRAIFAIPEVRQMYLRRLRTLMDDLLKPPGTAADDLHYEPRMDELAAQIAPDAALDAAKWNSHAWGNGSTGFCCPQSLLEAVEEMKSFYLPERRDQLYSGLASGAREIPDAQPERTIITFGNIEANPASGNQDEEYIELRNDNSIAADISGWTLNTGLDSQTVIFTFRGGTVIPAHSTLYVAANRTAFRARETFPTGGQSLFVVGDYAGRLSARGETIKLTNRQATRVDSVSTPALPSLAQSVLRVTELMYSPPATSDDTFANQEYEYVELTNVGTVAIDLSGVHFSEGIAFDFSNSDVTRLSAGERVLLVKNSTAFTERYGPEFHIAGQYTGYLENGGERLRLADAQNEMVLDFEYDNAWYPITDGQGFSLVIIDETAPFNTWAQPESWQPSTTEGGSPGTDR